jgi:hypothetical protein
MLGPNLLGRHLVDQQVSTKYSCGIPTATPGINLHSPVDRLTFHPANKQTNKKLNNELNKELKINMQQRGCCTVSTPGKGGVARS